MKNPTEGLNLMIYYGSFHRYWKTGEKDHGTKQSLYHREKKFGYREKQQRLMVLLWKLWNHKKYKENNSNQKEMHFAKSTINIINNNRNNIRENKNETTIFEWYQNCCYVMTSDNSNVKITIFRLLRFQRTRKYDSFFRIALHM